MGHLRIGDAIAFGHEPDYFGPEFVAFRPKPKCRLPKSDPYVKTTATEATDRQIREQIRLGIPLARIELVPFVPDDSGDCPSVRKNKRGFGLAKSYAKISKVGIGAAELTGHFDRERRRYLELSAQADLSRPGKRRTKERDQAYAVLKGFAYGLQHAEAAPLARAELHRLVAAVNAKQLGHVLKVLDSLALSGPERLKLAQRAPVAAFLNLHVQKRLLDRTLRSRVTGAPRILSEPHDRPVEILNLLPQVAELAFRQHATGKADADCVTPGDIWSYVDSLATHEGRVSSPFYLAFLKDCVRNIKRVPRQASLRRRGKSIMELAFADSVRLLESRSAPAAAAAAMPPARPRQQAPTAQSLHRRRAAPSAYP